MSSCRGDRQRLIRNSIHRKRDKVWEQKAEVFFHFLSLRNILLRQKRFLLIWKNEWMKCLIDSSISKVIIQRKAKLAVTSWLFTKRGKIELGTFRSKKSEGKGGGGGLNLSYYYFYLMLTDQSSSREANHFAQTSRPQPFESWTVLSDRISHYLLDKFI